MALTSIELTELKARLKSTKNARDSGVLSVRHGDTSTQYRSLAEMNSIIADMTAQIAAAEGTTSRGPRYIRQRTRGY